MAGAVAVEDEAGSAVAAGEAAVVGEDTEGTAAVRRRETTGTAPVRTALRICADRTGKSGSRRMPPVDNAVEARGKGQTGEEIRTTEIVGTATGTGHIGEIGTMTDIGAEAGAGARRGGGTSGIATAIVTTVGKRTGTGAVEMEEISQGRGTGTTTGTVSGGATAMTIEEDSPCTRSFYAAVKS